MAEMRYDENKENLRLPKNVRQIGKTQGQTKIYVEDYVITFINQLTESSPMEPKLAILLGYTVSRNNMDYVFIHGAVEASGVNITDDHVGFTSGIWSRIYDDIKTYFGDAKVAGWFLTRPGKKLKVTEKIRKIHVDNFPGENKTLFVIDPLDSEEFFYIYKQGELIRQEGYYIYYERNEQMQNYMIEYKDQKEADDIMNQVLIEEAQTQDHFSSVVPFMRSRKKKEKTDVKDQINKSMAKLTRAASLLLLLVVAVAGVTAVRGRNGDTFNLFGNSESDAQDAINQDVINIEEIDQVIESNNENESSAPEQLADAQQQINIEETQTNEISELPVAANVGQTYQIKEGDTLASISRYFYNDYAHVEDICQLNNIEDADTIYPGMTIVLP